MLDHLAIMLGDPTIVGLIFYCFRTLLEDVGSFSQETQQLLASSMRTQSFAFSPYERRAKGRAVVLAIQHVLGHLATLFQHETNINPAITCSTLDQCWIVLETCLYRHRRAGSISGQLCFLLWGAMPRHFDGHALH